MIDDTELLRTLCEQKEPVLARELASLLSRRRQEKITKTDLNKILYRLKEAGKASIDEKFRWVVVRERQSQQEPDRQSSSKQRGTTYYDILQVAKHAHPDVITKAYKALASLYHPDKAAGGDVKVSTERMQLINVAYATLSDPEKRKQYDQEIH